MKAWLEGCSERGGENWRLRGLAILTLLFSFPKKGPEKWGSSWRAMWGQRGGFISRLQHISHRWEWPSREGVSNDSWMEWALGCEWRIWPWTAIIASTVRGWKAGRHSGSWMTCWRGSVYFFSCLLSEWESNEKARRVGGLRREEEVKNQGTWDSVWTGGLGRSARPRPTQWGWGAQI